MAIRFPVRADLGSWGAVASALAIGALLGVALVAAYALQQTPAPLPDGTAIEGAVAGGVIEVAPPGPNLGALELEVRPNSGATVRIASASWATTWACTEPTLELRGLPAGAYATRVTPAGGTAIRDTVEVLAGRTCRYALANGRWTNEGCR